jgi:hypothetical protein
MVPHSFNTKILMANGIHLKELVFLMKVNSTRDPFLVLEAMDLVTCTAL